MRIEPRHKPLAAFHVISLADVVLLLLIYFMLTSTYVISAGLRVNLPQATAERVEAPEKIVITVTKEGMIYVNRDPVGLLQVAPKVSSLLSQNPKAHVVLMADEEVSLGLAVKVLDAARRAGATRFLIATRQVLP